MNSLFQGCIRSRDLVQCSHAEIIKIQLGGNLMATSRQHQEAHGIGQIEDQLNDQMEAAEEIQGQSKLDREIDKAARRDSDPLKDVSK